MAAETCVVVGGGLIGTHVATQLAEAGHEVAVLSRSFSEPLLDRADVDRGVRLVEGSVSEGDTLRDLLDWGELVFGAAGSSTPASAAQAPGEALDGSVRPALDLLSACQRAGTRRVVLASSGGTVYGRVRQVPTPEDHPTDPISVHGVNAVTIESFAEFYHRVHGLESVVLRYSNVYGPGGRARGGQGVIMAWCDALAHGRELALIGDGGVRRDFVYATDAAEATVAAAMQATPGIYNVGAGESASLDEVLELLQRAAGKQLDVRRAAGRPVDVPETCLDCTKLTNQTGWRPSTPLLDGIARTWEAVLAGASSRGSVIWS